MVFRLSSENVNPPGDSNLSELIDAMVFHARGQEGGRPSNFCAGPSPTTRQWIYPKSRREGSISISASQHAPALRETLLTG